MMTIRKKKINRLPKPSYFEFKGFLSFLILHELKAKSLTGEDLAKKIGLRKGVVLNSGTIYPTLKRLRKSGLVEFSRDGRKKFYSLTIEGVKELKKLYVLFSKYFFGLKKHIRRML